MMPSMLAFFDPITWAIVYVLATAAVSYGVMYLMKQKAQGPKAAGASEFDIPTAMVGRPVSHVRGKKLVTGINVLSPIYNYGYRKKKDDGNTVAIEYYFNLWVGICVVADGIKQMRAGGKVLWPTYKDITSEAADGTTDADLEKACWNAFGSYRREGGQYGHIELLYGGPTQTLPTSLANAFGDVPPGRGIVSALFDTQIREVKDKDGRGYYWGVTTYPKWPEFLIKSTDKNPDGSTIWLPAAASIGSDDDFNPIHAIREWITDPIVGRGLPTDLIGASFQTAANTVYGEGYGISYILDSAGDELQGYIDEVCEIIDGHLYFDQDTGKYEITLARDDYDPDTLETFDESDFWVSQFSRPSAGKTPSRVIVKFHDRETEDVGVGVDDDIALLEMQGAYQVMQEYDYRAFVNTQALADKIAAREQNQFSAMPAGLEIHGLRTMAHLKLGGVIKITYPALEIVTMICRVVGIEYGDISQGEVIIKLTEDVFGTIYTVFGTPSAPESNPADDVVETDNYATFRTVETAETGPY